MLKTNLIPYLLFGTHYMNRETCIDTWPMNKAREAQMIFKTVQEAEKQPIRRRHWQCWLPHLSSILEGRWQCKFFKAKPWILINISGCVPKLRWWPTIQLVQYLNFCATFLLPLYPRGHPHCVVAKGHVCNQRIQGGYGHRKNSTGFSRQMPFSWGGRCLFEKGWMIAFKNPIKGVWKWWRWRPQTDRRLGFHLPQGCTYLFAPEKERGLPYEMM